MSIIQVSNLTFGYEGSIENVFENVTFNLDTDWKLGLIGRNGKGKTTLLNLLRGKEHYQGTISKNVEFDYFPSEISNKEKMSIEVVQEIAPNAEDWEIIKEINLLKADAEILYRPFNTLSGGEQQMLAVARALMCNPKLLLLDEPSLGLAPLIIKDIFDTFVEIKKQGTTILIVEQNALATLKIADYAYVLEIGKVTLEGKSNDLLNDEKLINAYLGGKK